MRLSSTFHNLRGKLGMENAITTMAEAGFDALDFSFFTPEFYDEGTDGEEFRKYFTGVRAFAESKGLVFNQAHAPFPSSRPDEKVTEGIFWDIVRSMRNASYLGIPIIVVHPVQHLDYYTEGNPELLFEMNMDFYNRLLPYAKEYGIRIAVENMWQMPGGHKISHSTCSRPEEFIRYVDALDKDWFCACLDIGHTTLVCEDPAAFIRALGKDRLAALHVHDVNGIEDSHTLPYQGIINWDTIAAALSDIGYTGDFTYEAEGFIKRTPPELYAAAARFMAETGRSIMRKI